MSGRFQLERHPSADQLSAMVEQALPAHERVQLLAHLADCAECRGLLYELEQLNTDAMPAPQARVQPIAAGKRWYFQWTPVFSGAAAAAVVVFVLAIAYMRPHKPDLERIAKVTSAPTPPGRLVPGADPANMPAKSAVRPQAKAPARQPEAGGAVAEPSPDAPVGSGKESGVPLGLKAPNEKIEVSATASEIATLQSAPPAEVVYGNSVRGLPINGRSFVQIVDLTPAISLPSRQAVASMVSHEGRILAIDVSGTLFFSQDAGRHWKKIRAHWPGRAVTVSLISPQSQQPPASPVIAEAPEEPKVASETKGCGIVSRDIAVADATATLSGVVSDPSGAVVPNAEVTVCSTNTGQEQTALTDDLGQYRFSNLEPGVYQVAATSRGFRREVVQGVVVGGSHTEDVNMVLAVGQATQTVQVEATAITIQTDSAVIDKEQPQKRATERSPVFELRTDGGAVWTSSDGRHWKPR